MSFWLMLAKLKCVQLSPFVNGKKEGDFTTGLTKHSTAEAKAPGRHCSETPHGFHALLGPGTATVALGTPPVARGTTVSFAYEPQPQSQENPPHWTASYQETSLLNWPENRHKQGPSASTRLCPTGLTLQNRRLLQNSEERINMDEMPSRSQPPLQNSQAGDSVH